MTPEQAQQTEPNMIANAIEQSNTVRVLVEQFDFRTDQTAIEQKRDQTDRTAVRTEAWLVKTTCLKTSYTSEYPHPIRFAK